MENIAKLEGGYFYGKHCKTPSDVLQFFLFTEDLIVANGWRFAFTIYSLTPRKELFFNERFK